MLAGLLLAGAACTTGGDVASSDPAAEPRGQRSEPVPTAQIPCADTIDPDADIPDTYTVILDVVALPTADRADTALQTRHDEDSPQPNYWAKSGLVARPGVPFTIEVNGSSETAQIGWGSPAEFGSSFTPPGCTGEGWMAFPGGFLVDEPRCLDVTIRARGEEETVKVGVGAPCDGQQPPPEPTDP